MSTQRENVIKADELIKALNETAKEHGYRIEKPSIQGPAAVVKATFLKLPEDNGDE